MALVISFDENITTSAVLFSCSTDFKPHQFISINGIWLACKARLDIRTVNYFTAHFIAQWTKSIVRSQYRINIFDVYIALS